MKELRPGLKVKLKFSISTIRSFEIVCPIKWIEYDRISLEYPYDKSELMKYLYEGKELDVVIYSEKGVFSFDSIVIDSPFNIDFVIELPEEKTKIQRREYIRVPLKLEFILNNENQTIKTETVNIGGGGVRFLANKEFNAGNIWAFSLFLPIAKSIVKGNGEILYSIKQDDDVVSVIKFLEIEENDRNKIIKTCFDEEASRLRSKNMSYNLRYS